MSFQCMSAWLCPRHRLMLIQPDTPSTYGDHTYRTYCRRKRQRYRNIDRKPHPVGRIVISPQRFSQRDG